jgi:hypothetical protein
LGAREENEKGHNGMWFLFGFITLIAISAYALDARINAPSKGEVKEIGGFVYWYDVIRQKRKITRFRLSIKGPEAYDFSFRLETWLDRVFKKIGVCSEFQVGHDDFDRAIYIVSDDRYLCTQLAGNINLVTEILKLFKEGETLRRKIRELRCASGYLSVSYKTVDHEYTEHQIFMTAQEAIPALARIGNHLQKVPMNVKSKWRDPFIIKAAIILATSTGLAITGVAHSIRIYWTKIPFTVDADLLWRDSVLVGLTVVAALIAATIIFLGRSARTHLVLIELLFIGTFGAVATSFAELRDINMEFDASPDSVYAVKLVDTYRKGGRHPRYYVILEDWTKEGARQKIRVSSGFFYEAVKGEMITIRQKPGFFGYRWVDVMEKQMQ